MSPWPAAVVLILVSLGGIPRPARADAPPPSTSDVPPLVAPEDARATLRVADGLEVRLLAHEPMVRQPSSM